MNKLTIVTTIAAAALALSVNAAFARNMHCAGGIQYVVQGLKDKERGNTEDYVREMNKAVDQLSMCAAEDPNDLEAIGYLGWAYAEVESAGPAGVWFQKAIDGLCGRGEKKKCEMVTNNRASYWARAYNDGINNIKTAQEAYPEYTKTPSDDEKPLKEEATNRFQEAILDGQRPRLHRFHSSQ